MMKKTFTLLILAVLAEISFSTVTRAEVITNQTEKSQTYKDQKPVYQKYRNKRLKKTKLHSFKKWIAEHTIDIAAVLCVFSASSLAAYYFLPSFSQAEEVTPPTENPSDINETPPLIEIIQKNPEHTDSKTTDPDIPVAVIHPTIIEDENKQDVVSSITDWAKDHPKSTIGGGLMTIMTLGILAILYK